MEPITTNDLRQKFLDFFKSKNHAIIPGASIVPKEDPTALFTTAGMQPLVPYLMGRDHPAGRRLADAQVCIRTTDIDEVGDDTHLTCFEMLGNWSLGDYFKDDSIKMSWEFLTSKGWLGIDQSRLAVTCFAGDELVPKDDESAAIWQSLGVPAERIHFYGRDDNWWGPAGQTGPCGPDTEIFYWTGDGEPTDEPGTNASWVEIWNNVFMQYSKQEDGLFVPLEQQNVDTGMGLERTVAILNGQKSVYDTDVLDAIIYRIRQTKDNSGLVLSDYHLKPGKTVKTDIITREDIAKRIRAERIVADHVRASVFMIAAGLTPTNTDRGYVLRKLIRRAIRFSKTDLKLNNNFLPFVADIVVGLMKDFYPHLAESHVVILEALKLEEEKFNKTVDQGLREFDKVTRGLESGAVLDGPTTFRLYDTYGFPLEMTQELADERGLIVDVSGFEQSLLSHQEKSRTATAGTFKSGLADHGEATVRYHTATHLLNQALREALGDHVQQRGSNITPERLRFDFSNPEKLTDEQKQAVSDLVNQQIAADLPVTAEEMPLAEAFAAGAVGVFGERYPDTVTVYSVGNFSKEICTGPHIAHTGELGQFTIVKEESAGAGIRRIKATLS
jgi:alanyl-tRNA synthetase